MEKIKKFFNKDVIVLILMFVSFLILAVYMNTYTRDVVDLKSYGFLGLKNSILWIGFSLSWILLFLLLISLLPRKQRSIVYGVLLVLWNVIFVAQICYLQQLGKFMIFSDLFLAGEGLQYIKAVFINMNIGMILSCIASVAIGVSAIIINKETKLKYKRNKYVIISVITLIILFRFFSFFSLGVVADANSWEESYNTRNVYNNFTNPNTSMFVSGLYEYNIRAVYKYFYNLITFDKTAVKKNVDEYNNIYGSVRENNDYTGLFKDKNVIFILMESIDSWIIDEDTMPTLYNMMQTGMNFTNRYSPFFNGGQTINSEFAFNTGLYAISDKDTIYDIDDVDYSYSMANMLHKNGYIVNSLHANSGTFYNRTNFHSWLGYEHHYALKDLQDSGILNNSADYFSDSQLINDDDVFDLITNNKTNDKFLTFITSYSAHLEYTKENKLYMNMDYGLDKKYDGEELIYRTLAKDTDEFLRILKEKLNKSGLLDDTVIVMAADHYVYGYSDSDYVALKKGVLNDRKLLQNTPLVIWNSDMENEQIDTILDSADILPTLLNLLDINYNPNNYMGTDVFSDNHDDFVWFSDGSYIAGKDCTITNEAILTKTNYNISKNRSILLTNYYGKK